MGISPTLSNAQICWALFGNNLPNRGAISVQIVPDSTKIVKGYFLMGRPPSGKPREFVRLPGELWNRIKTLAHTNHRTKDLQIEAMLCEWMEQNKRVKERT